jgi:EmrB/QacA subfamily drug resistance transporter
MSGFFLAALDMMIVNVSLRTIADDLAGLTLSGWISSSYITASTVSALVFGRLAARYGSRDLYLIALAVFIAGTLLSGFAQSIPQLAGIRALKGVGAGGMMTLALTIMAEVMPREKRTRPAAFTGVLFTAATLLGPWVGGWFAEAGEIGGIASWRWMFFLPTPVGAAIWLVVFRRAPRYIPAEKDEFDVAGCVLLCLGVSLAMAAFDVAIRMDRPILGGLLAIVGVVLLLLFYCRARHIRSRSLLPTHLLERSGFSTLNLLNFLLGCGIFACGGIVPLYFQLVKGFSPSVSGLLLVPQAIVATLASLVVDRWLQTRHSEKVPMVIGFWALSGSAFLWSTANAGTNQIVLVATTMLYGTGLGICMQTLLIAMQRSLADTDIGLANGLYTFGRQFGGACAVLVVMGSLFAIAESKVSDSLWDHRRQSGMQHSMTDDRSSVKSRLSFNDTRFLERIPPEEADLIRGGLSDAMSTIFLALSGLFAFGAIATGWRRVEGNSGG